MSLKFNFFLIPSLSNLVNGFKESVIIQTIDSVIYYRRLKFRSKEDYPWMVNPRLPVVRKWDKKEISGTRVKSLWTEVKSQTQKLTFG